MFCLRGSVSSLTGTSILDVQSNFKIFNKLFVWFVDGEEKINLEDVAFSKFECCEECLNITQKFCDFYHQYKCLKLQLVWIVCKIERIMRLANKVPTRVSQIKQVLQDFDTNELNGYEMVENFRKEILQKCNLSLPKILRFLI